MNRLIEVVAVAALLAVSGCATEKSENPLSPTVAGPIPGVEISAPRPLEPGGGQMIASDRQPVTLLLENASSNGPRPLTYMVEIATDAGFANKVFTRNAIAPGPDGRTSLRLPDALGSGRSYLWRVKAEDGANTGPFSSPATFNVFTPVVIDVPTLLAPINGATTSSLHPDFRLANAPRTGPAGPITYTLELAENEAFANKFAVWQFAEGSNETRFTAVADLLPGRQYFWHARASDTSNVGPWSSSQVFRTPVPVVIPDPGGGGGGGTSCATSSTPLNIVECRRSQYGTHMTASQTVAFLRGVATDLNAKRVDFYPFGILVKPGSECNGYSCDIICSGNGAAQRQWDVLGDGDPNVGAAIPVWNGPLGSIAVRTCEIQ
jgi:hypothetical protein